MSPELPKRTGTDLLHAGVKGGLSTIPIVGGFIAEIFSLVITPALESRKDEFLMRLNEGIEKLATRMGKTAEEFAKGLEGNRTYIDTHIAALRLSLVTSQEDKLMALRNAVLNAALPTAPDETRQAIFLGIIDRLTQLHIRVLQFVVEFRDWHIVRSRQPRNYSPALPLWKVVIDEFPEFSESEILATHVLNELSLLGLLEHPADHDISTDSLLEGLSGRPHHFAKEFLSYIRDPMSTNSPLV